MDYTIRLTQDALNLLAQIETLHIEDGEEKISRIEEEIAALEELKKMGFSKWYQRNKLEIMEGIFNPQEDFFDELKRLKEIKLFPQIHIPRGYNYHQAVGYDELLDTKSEKEIWNATNRERIQYYLRKYLYGLVGAVYSEGGIRSKPNGQEVKTHDSQISLFVPAYVNEDVQSCIDGGMLEDGSFSFESQISDNSLPVLKYILDRTLELKEQYRGNWHPRFTVTSVANATGITKNSVKEASRDLTGIVCETLYIRESSLGYKRKFFLPPSRYDLAKELVSF